MKIRKPKALVTILVSVLMLGTTLTVAKALSFGDIFKIGGIAFLVDSYRKPINEAINKALGERQAEAKGATKVVAILSVGSGGYVGAAQVVGTPSGVDNTQAVVQVELPIGSFRATGLVPVSRKTATGSPTRVKGVGVSAVVEFKI